MKLGKSEIAEPFLRMSLIAMVTRPFGFSDMPLAGGFDVVDAPETR